MIGSLFAFLTAILFALNAVYIRRAVLNVSNASLGTLVTIPMALPFIFLFLSFTGQVRSILNFSWQAYVWLSLAGIVTFVLGRSLYYKCAQLVGANIAGLLRRVNILVSVILGISLLNEPLSWQIAIGVLFIINGITLAGFSSRMVKNSSGQILKIPAKALFYGFGNGVAWGLGPILIKLGLKDSGSPISGAFISFLAATLVLSVSLLNQSRRTSTAHITGKAAGLFFIAGLFSCTANLTRYAALSLAPASIVVPLMSTSPVFLLVFSFLLNRNLEMFSMPIVIGTVMVVIGGIFLI